VNVRRRPGLRFIAEVILIVATAVVTGFMHVGAWAIAGAVFAVWLAAAVLEYALSSRRHGRPQPVAVGAAELAAEPSLPERVRILDRAPEPELEATPEPEPCLLYTSDAADE